MLPGVKRGEGRLLASSDPYGPPAQYLDIGPNLVLPGSLGLAVLQRLGTLSSQNNENDKHSTLKLLGAPFRRNTKTGFLCARARPVDFCWIQTSYCRARRLGDLRAGERRTEAGRRPGATSMTHAPSPRRAWLQ